VKNLGRLTLEAQKDLHIKKQNKHRSKCCIEKNPNKTWDSILFSDYCIFQGDVRNFVRAGNKQEVFDLIVTSPPYNIGKEYEKQIPISSYLQEQEDIINKTIPYLKTGGSVCWQTGNYVVKNEIIPLDIEFATIFKKHNLQLRNRIIWHFGHGLHCQKRFSGRYETILWYTKTKNNIPLHTFNLDAVRIASKYPGKKRFRGPSKGEFSSHPSGKNPEDVWTNIPNVKSNHIEKTIHPCQFPVGLIQRLILALTNEGDIIFDPFSGVSSTGVAAAATKRRYVGCEIVQKYTTIGSKRINEILNGRKTFRDHSLPIYDHTKSPLSKRK